MPVLNTHSASFKTVVNNAGLDPIQGYDADVWCLDQGTGAYNLVGRFTSIQIAVRNATEAYLEFNQRIARQLDGEIDIAWVMERGQLDGRVIEQTFGTPALTRELRLNRMPRLQITFSLISNNLSVNENDAVIEALNGTTSGVSLVNKNAFSNRSVNQEMVLTFCKIENFTMAASSGRSIVANRWEGKAEGIEVVQRQSTDGGGLEFVAVSSNQARQDAANTVVAFPQSDFNNYSFSNTTSITGMSSADVDNAWNLYGQGF